MGKILRLDRTPEELERRQVGRVHVDGSITFRGRRYRDIGQVPADCQALRPDLSCHRQWRSIWERIDPQRRTTPAEGPPMSDWSG